MHLRQLLSPAPKHFVDPRPMLGLESHQDSKNVLNLAMITNTKELPQRFLKEPELLKLTINLLLHVFNCTCSLLQHLFEWIAIFIIWNHAFDAGKIGAHHPIPLYGFFNSVSHALCHQL